MKIHTFEMIKEIVHNSELVELMEKLEELNYIYKREEKYASIKYIGLCDRGITIFILRYRYGIPDRIILKINPQKVLGKEDKRTLFDVDEEKLKCCFSVIGEVLEEYQLDLSEFRVDRIDFTRDIQFERSEVVDIIIKLLNKTGIPYHYRRTSYGGRVYDNSYDITKGADSIVVYNKESQLMERGDLKDAEYMKGVLRVEVRAAVKRSIYEEGILYYDNLLAMGQYAEQMLKNIFISGFYIKLEKAIDILREECQKKCIGKRIKGKLEKTIFLLNKVARHRSLRECISGINTVFCYETTQDILKHLADRKINIMTISAKETIQVIPDIKHLLRLKSEDEMREDCEFLKANKLIDKVPKYHIR